MTSLLQDLKFALRGFRRTPAFTLIAVLTLAIGIGANSAIFSVVDSVVLRPLPYPDSEGLVMLEQTRADGGVTSASWLDFVDWRDQSQVFTGVTAFHGDSLVLTGVGDRPQRLNGMAVTSNYFDVLGVAPAMGRGFVAGEDSEGKNRVAVLTWQAWQKNLGADPRIVGRTVTLDGQPYTVVGVLPESFRLVTDDDLLLFVPKPRQFDREIGQMRGARYQNVIGRLKPGVTLTEAQANLSAIGARLAAAYPDTNTGRGVKVTGMHERLTADLRPALLILLGAVGFVLLIACANVANLLLARASVRHRELAIRVALGAGRARVVRQMLAESVLLALLGGTLGVMLALWGLDALRGVIPAELARFHTITIDGRVLGFTLAVSLLTGIAFGLVPALSASASNPSEALKEAGTRATAHAGRQRARNVFVASEIALATLLLVGAALMLRSFQRVNRVDPGFHPENLLAGFVAIPDTRYDTPDKLADFYHRFLDELSALPGAQSASVGAPLPFSGIGYSLSFTITGKPPLPAGQRNIAWNVLVSPGWFATLGIPLRAGRAFTDADDQRHATPTIIVNQALARQFFGGEDPIGKHMVIGRGKEAVDREVVGVVGDVRAGSLEEEPPPTMYVPFAQKPWSIIGWSVRTTATAGMAEALQAAVSRVDKDQPLGDVMTMEQLMRDSLARRRLNTLLLALFGAVAMLLALIGVYGVMSYTVTQRIPEIGIRMALGARPGDVTRMVVGKGLLLAAIGVGVGLAGALAVGRVLTGLLYGVSPSDPLTYVAIAALLLLVAGLASFLPARRAARVDPMIALRSE